MKRPGSGEVSRGDYAYYWSAMANGTRLRGVTVAISSMLGLAVVEVTAADERIMRLKLNHTFGFMSLVYAPTEMCDKDV